MVAAQYESGFQSSLNLPRNIDTLFEKYVINECDMKIKKHTFYNHQIKHTTKSQTMHTGIMVIVQTVSEALVLFCIAQNPALLVHPLCDASGTH